MSRSPFGWSLPPGVTNRMIEDQVGDEGPCECCGHDSADCICPECPICGAMGNPKCYSSPYMMVIQHENSDHGLKFNREQLIGQAEMRIANLRVQIVDEEAIIEYLKNGGEI
jgi:hypothetical protein